MGTAALGTGGQGSSAGRTAAMKKLLRRMRRNRLGPFAALFLAVMVAFALFPGVFATHDPLQQSLMKALQGSSSEHWLGTDHLGRDTWSRIVYGTRVSLQVGLVAVGIAAVSGMVVGLLAGYRGGWIDASLMRMADAIWSFPYLVLALALVTIRGPGLFNIMLAIAVVYMPGFARLARALTISTKNRDFVQAAIATGMSNTRIVLKHITPNIIAPIVVHASLSIGHAIIFEASLSFLGVGVPPPTPTWGGMLRDAYGYLEYAPLFAIAVGSFIFFTVLSANIFGDWVRDLIDPRLKGL